MHAAASISACSGNQPHSAFTLTRRTAIGRCRHWGPLPANAILAFHSLCDERTLHTKQISASRSERTAHSGGATMSAVIGAVIVHSAASAECRQGHASSTRETPHARRVSPQSASNDEPNAGSAFRSAIVHPVRCRFGSSGSYPGVSHLGRITSGHGCCSEPRNQAANTSCWSEQQLLGMYRINCRSCLGNVAPNRFLGIPMPSRRRIVRGSMPCIEGTCRYTASVEETIFRIAISVRDEAVRCQRGHQMRRLFGRR